MRVRKESILKGAWLIYFVIVLNFNNLPGIQLLSLVGMIMLTFFCIPRKAKIKNLSTGKWYAVFFAFMSLSLLWAEYKDISSGVYEATFRVLVFVICLDLFCDSKEKTDYMLNATIVAGVFYAVHVLLTTRIADYGTLNVGLSVNAQRNFVGQICALVSIISYVLFMNEEVRKKRVRYIIAALICYTVACISGSRKAFLMFPIAIIAYLLTKRSLKKKIRYFLLIVLALIVFLTLFVQIPFFQEYFGERLLALFDDSIVDKSIAGRNYLKEVAILLFMRHPIIGMGCDNVRSYLISIGYPSQVYAHNNYLELLADYGIIGFILFYRYHVKVLLKTYRDRWSNKYTKLMFVYILAMLFMDYGQVSYQKHMYIYMLVVVCSCLKWIGKDNSLPERG